jgi:hypothetical protein
MDSQRSSNVGSCQVEIEISHQDLGRLLDLALALHQLSGALLHSLQTMIPQEDVNEAYRAGA